MSPRRPLVCLALLALAAAGRASAVCTAGEIATGEGAACAPSSATCMIAKSYSIDDGCTLDFGAQSLVVGSNAHLTIGSGTVTIRAAAVTVSGLIDGVGSATNNASGGMLMVETIGALAVPLHGSIDVQGKGGGGDVVVRAGGSVSIDGKVQADSLTADGAGGLVDISTSGDIAIGTTGTLSAQGGNNSDGGGEIDLTAGGALALQSDLDVDGFCGGVLELQAGGQVTMQGADASGAGDAGSGGCVDVTAGASTMVLGTITVDGVTGMGSDGGGCGGLICLDGGLGDVTVQTGALVSADGASPDGGGGNVTLMARGNANINGAVTARGPSGETCGGDVCVETGFDVTVASQGSLDLSGGCDGGELEFDAGRDLTLNGPVDVSGTASGSLGGDVAAYAGLLGSGSLMVTSTIDVSSPGSCSDDNGCGLGGTTDLRGCNLTLTSMSVVNASGPDAGENDLTAREQVIVQGTLNALNMPTMQNGEGTVGINFLLYPARKPPIVAGNGIEPELDLTAATTCSTPGQTIPTPGQTTPPCLTPCPLCGDGVVEFPETCDRGLIPPQSCSGCSAYCQTEDCDDGLVCTGDSCNPTYGCINQPTPGCSEPTTTATGTPPTPTATPTASGIPSASASPSLTSTASVTRTATSTPAPTGSATATPTGIATATPTGTATPSPTRTVTATPTGTAAATPSGTATPPSTATVTVTQAPTATPTASGTPSASPSLTSTVSVTRTATGTPTRSPTGTGTATPPRTATPTTTGTATPPPTATVTVTQTSSPDPTSTPPGVCPGDCNGNGVVTVNELIVGVDILLGSTSNSVCPAFDRDGNGTVSISEIIAAVNAALDGC